MKLLTIFFLSVFLCFSQWGRAEVLFEDGFEGAALDPRWTITGTNDFRVAIHSDHGPATGQGHLIFDDAIADGKFSSSEAWFTVDLSNKKQSVLTFKAKSLGDELHVGYAGVIGGANLDGVSASVDGVNWFHLEYLVFTGSDWNSYTVSLDSVFSWWGGEPGPLRIRFSQYDNGPVPIDGIAIDDVKVTAIPDQRIVVELAASSKEGDASQTGYLFLSTPELEPTAIALQASLPGQLILPDSVTVPAGETMVSFEYSVVDDAVVNLTRMIAVEPVISGEQYSAIPGWTVIDDNEAPPVVTLTLPAEIPEESYYYYGTGVVSIPEPIGVDLELGISSDSNGRLSHNSTVTIEAGETQASFNLVAYENSVSQPDILVTITVESPYTAAVGGTVLVKDDDTPDLAIDMPASLVEGGSATVRLTLGRPMTYPVTVYLTNSGYVDFDFPAWVTIPQGSLSATFMISVADDAVKNLIRSCRLWASAPGLSGADFVFNVTDNEAPPVLSLVLPASVREGENPSDNASVRLDAPAAVEIEARLTGTPDGQLSLPYSVIIPAGQTQSTFTVKAANDSRIDGDLTVSVKAVAPGLASASASVVAADDETRTFVIGGEQVFEGRTVQGWVELPGTLQAPLVVSLSSSDPERLALPSTVVIPAGYDNVAFPMTAPDNDLKDGSQPVVITATAATFTAAERSVTVHDNDPASYEISTVPELIPADTPLYLTFSPRDADGNPIGEPDAVLDLFLVKPDGTTLALDPASLDMASGGGSTSVDAVLPFVEGPGLRIRGVDGAGTTVESTPFSLMKTRSLASGDLVWDQGRSRFYASVGTGAAEYAGKVVAIDPATLQVTGEVEVGQNPGQLKLTDDGQFLYVALKANGTIAKIDAATLTVLSVIPLGNYSASVPFLVSDFCTVAGQPHTLVVSRFRVERVYNYYYGYYDQITHSGVAVYDGAVQRTTTSQNSPGSTRIEPSADPTVYFGFSNDTSDYSFRVLKVNADGITQTAAVPNVPTASGSGVDIRSAGNLVFSTNGHRIDGPRARRTGSFATSGLVCPDLDSGLVHFVNYSTLSACNATSLATLRSVSLPWLQLEGLVRWGSGGLAIRTPDRIMLVSSPQMVPSGPPADLKVEIQATPDPVPSQQQVTYSITVTNSGPNTAKEARLDATLPSGSTISSSTATKGSPVTSGPSISLAIGDLAVDETAVLTVIVLPDQTRAISCSASAFSWSPDPLLADNYANRMASFSFIQGQNVVNPLRLNIGNLIADPSGGLWVTTLPSADPPQDPVLLRINPQTGKFTEPVAITGTPAANSMAISSNGRYLYFGLSDAPDVLRYDLSVSPPVLLRIPLGQPVTGATNSARDIEVLDGDGTSFVMVGNSDLAAAVYDGTTRRAIRTAGNSIQRIERGSAAGTFVGYSIFNNYVRLLTVTPSGVSVSQNLTSYTGAFDIRTSGNLVLSSAGELWTSDVFTYKRSLGTTGAPCVDAAYSRAFIANSYGLYAYDTATGTSLGMMTAAATNGGSQNRMCVRWGVDGLAFTGGDGALYVARWSVVVPPDADFNADGVADAWVERYFSTAPFDPKDDRDGDGIPEGFEYAFMSSPVSSDSYPVRFASTGGSPSPVVRFRLPLRRGFNRSKFVYETSPDLLHWSEATATESVVSSKTVDGVTMDTVEAVFPAPATGAGFLRLRWKP